MDICTQRSTFLFPVTRTTDLSCEDHDGDLHAALARLVKPGGFWVNEEGKLIRSPEIFAKIPLTLTALSPRLMASDACPDSLHTRR